MDDLSIKQNQSAKINQNQRLLLSVSMQQALDVLQMPTIELAEWLQLQIEQNPILEIDFPSSPEKETFETLCSIEHESGLCKESSDPTSLEIEKKQRQHRESLLIYPTSLYEHLMSQAQLHLNNQTDLMIASQIIGHLDKRGFLSSPLTEIAEGRVCEFKRILLILQTLDPPGICASNLQESLCIQLSIAGKKDSIAFMIIQNHFQELLANKIPLIAKKLNLPTHQLQQIISCEISCLNLRPGALFEQAPIRSIIPDIYLQQIGKEWHIQINNSLFPHFYIQPIYEKTLNDPARSKKEKKFIQRHISSGTWLQKILKRREEILLAITKHLIEKQGSFLSGDQKTLIPMNIKETAEQIGIHESTTARAISNKYIFCHQGIFSLRSFFTQGIDCPNGQKISNHTLRRLLAQAIENEDKENPLSDEAIASHFKKKGLSCARRTITKYRKKLQIEPASRRRKWLS